MEIEVTLPGGDRVDARFGSHTLVTDQDDSAPAPFALFLASIATCSGLYVARFCRKRGIPTEGIRIRQRSVKSSATHRIDLIEISIELPAGFPGKYVEAVKRAAGQCAVKKHMEQAPTFEVRATVAELAGHR